MAIVSRIDFSGIFYTNVGLDEVTQTTISETPTGIFASEFDEVSINPITNGLAKRETSTGKILVAGYFDEYTTLS